MKLHWVAPAGALIGGGLAFWLIWYYDRAGVAQSFVRLGWGGLTAIVAVRGVIVGDWD